MPSCMEPRVKRDHMKGTNREISILLPAYNNVWIGGSVTILPGVTIGDNVTIGAGSVVVKDIPSDSLAVGNPARVVKHIPVKGQ